MGDCCGNDPEDIGVLRPEFEIVSERNVNAVMCLPLMPHVNAEFIPFSPNPLPKQDSVFSWIAAEDDWFKIHKINRSGLLYDAMSNYENWFVCDALSGNTGLNSVYNTYETNVDNTNTPAPLLSEFDILPPADINYNYGTSSEIGDDEPTTSGEGSLIAEDGRSISLVESDVVDQNSFADDIVVIGSLVSTPCDIDGDGFDGPYTHDSSDEDWYNINCDNPSPPFDCDDDSTSRFPGSSLVCKDVTSTSDNNCNDIFDIEEYCIPPNSYGNDCDIDNWDPEVCKLSPQEMAPRFVCLSEQLDAFTTMGSFAECCGYSTDFCSNPNGRREGAFAHTLRDFSFFKEAECNAPDVNCVLKYGVNKPEPFEVENNYPFSVSFATSVSDMKIKDWSSYDALEFYVYFAANFEQRIRVGRLVGEAGYMSGYSWYLDEPIIKYAVNEPRLGKWLHIIIPITEFEPTPTHVGIVVLYADAEDLNKYSASVSSESLGSGLVNIIGVDKLHLSKENSPVCTGTVTSKWISNLDDFDPNQASVFEQSGRAACNAIPSYGWTGSACCGDDTGLDLNGGYTLIGDDTVKEYYNDTEAGCWGGNRVTDGERMMLVEYTLTHEKLYPQETSFEKSCTSPNRCAFFIPQVPGLIIGNPNALLYDITIVSPSGVKRQSVGEKTILLNETANGAMLKAESVPMQLVYFNNSFASCNADPIVLQKQNTLDQEDLVSEENQFGSCDVLDDYFCDHDGDGEDTGWSAESLSTYSLSNEILLENGTFIDVGGVVTPDYRSYEKKTYNLIPNGGFEKVR